jgi:hypothetical protein
MQERSMHVDRHAQQFRIWPKILELSGGHFACGRLAIKPALSEALKQYYNKTISREWSGWDERHGR